MHLSSRSLRRLQSTLVTLALAGAFMPAQAANTYAFRVSAPGIVAGPAQDAPPPSTPAPARNYARLMPGTQSFTLGADGLSATHMGYKGNGDIIANVGLTSGKWYWEVRRNAGLGHVAIGIGPSSAASGDGWGVYATSGRYGTAYLAGFGLGDAIPNIKNVTMPTPDNDLLGFGLDMDTGVLRVYRNCVEHAIWSGWTGPHFPMVASGGGQPGGTVAVNFGATPFTCPVPAGFNAGVWET